MSSLELKVVSDIFSGQQQIDQDCDGVQHAFAFNPPLTHDKSNPLLFFALASNGIILYWPLSFYDVWSSTLLVGSIMQSVIHQFSYISNIKLLSPLPHSCT